MATTIRAVFDGEVLRPEEPLPLRADTTYVIIVNGEAPAGASAEAEAVAEPEAPYALTEIGRLADDMGSESAAAPGTSTAMWPKTIRTRRTP